MKLRYDDKEKMIYFDGKNTLTLNKNPIGIELEGFSYDGVKGYIDNVYVEGLFDKGFWYKVKVIFRVVKWVFKKDFI